MGIYNAKKWQGTNSYRIYKEVLQINNKKVTTSIGKWAKEINRQTPKVDKHMKIASESL